MIEISTPLSISSSVRDIERLLRESPPFLDGGEDVNLGSRVSVRAPNL
jgi:hypothetical protein